MPKLDEIPRTNHVATIDDVCNTLETVRSVLFRMQDLLTNEVGALRGALAAAEEDIEDLRGLGNSEQPVPDPDDGEALYRVDMLFKDSYYDMFKQLVYRYDSVEKVPYGSSGKHGGFRHRTMAMVRRKHLDKLKTHSTLFKNLGRVVDY